MHRIGLLWREEWDPPDGHARLVETCKLHGVFNAFASLGVAAEPIVYSDSRADSIRDQMLALDAVLVWVNPIEQGIDRARLDPVLDEVAGHGVFVSAHPGVIRRMATKEVLADTQSMSWGTPTRVHRSPDALRDRLVDLDAPAVLKRHRGMGGNGVWRVEPPVAGTVVVQHALAGALPERLPLESFAQRCAPYFADGGFVVEQPYQPRLAEGMIRAYLTHDRVVGFTHQYPRGLLPPGIEPGPPGKVFDPPDDPRYETLQSRLESQWIPELASIVGVDRLSLPVIWDADFLYGPRDAGGGDAFVLCEINACSTFAFPEFAMPGVARATLDRL